MGDELDDVPGSRIPAESLHMTLEYRAGVRRQRREDLAGRLLAAAITGCSHGLTSSGPWEKLATGAVRLADTLMRANDEFDRPTPPPVQPAAVAVNGGPHTGQTVVMSGCTFTDGGTTVPSAEHQRAYLYWLHDRGGSCMASECPLTLFPKQSADVRRHLLKRGLIATTHDGTGPPLTVTGYALTAAGCRAVGDRAGETAT